MNGNSLEVRVAKQILEKSSITGIVTGDGNGDTPEKIGKLFIERDPMLRGMDLVKYLQIKRFIDSETDKFDDEAFYRAVGAGLQVPHQQKK